MTNADDTTNQLELLIERHNNEAAKRLLLQLGLDVLLSDTRTPLIHASFYNNEALSKYLLERGCDLNHQDHLGYTAAHAAAESGHIGIIRLLLQHEADLNIADKYGNTALFKATFNARGYMDIVEALVLAGADPRHKNTAGRSPLDFAKQINDEELSAILSRGHPE